MRQLHPQERRRIRRHRPRQRRPKPREKRPVPTLRIEPLHHPPNGNIPLRRLQPTLHSINREHRNPHRHARTRTRTRNSRQAELARRLARDRVLGRKRALDVLVGSEVGGGAGAVAGERGGGAAEDGAQAAFGVELAHDVGAAGVFGLFAWRELLLALDLQDDLDALEGGGDGCHGDGGEEAGGGDLADGEGAVGGDGAGRADDVFAEVVAPEGDGDCGEGG